MGRGSGGSPTVSLLVLLGLVFLVQGFVLTTAGQQAHENLFMLSVPLSAHPWTIVTNVYAHGSLSHLVANAVGLAIFGFVLERDTPPLRFHAFFLLAGALSGVAEVTITAVATRLLLDEAVTVHVLGASGGIFALLGYLLSGNRLTDGVVGSFRIPPNLQMVLFAAVAVAITAATAQPQVALVAHFTGLMVGLIGGRKHVLRRDAG